MDNVGLRKERHSACNVKTELHENPLLQSRLRVQNQIRLQVAVLRKLNKDQRRTCLQRNANQLQNVGVPTVDIDGLQRVGLGHEALKLFHPTVSLDRFDGDGH